jgi:hypothetical protein
MCSTWSIFDRRLNERAVDAFRRIQYIEQPTARDLALDRANTMFADSRILVRSFIVLGHRCRKDLC